MAMCAIERRSSSGYVRVRRRRMRRCTWWTSPDTATGVVRGIRRGIRFRMLPQPPIPPVPPAVPPVPPDSRAPTHRGPAIPDHVGPLCAGPLCIVRQNAGAWRRQGAPGDPMCRRESIATVRCLPAHLRHRQVGLPEAAARASPALAARRMLLKR